jgi:pyruvate/2-oxoglutarate dehydrogenase complex dihydrolipoamide acyltransferase (E2) component
MPKAAVSMEEGMLVEWFVEDGATVKEGEQLYAVETEKSTIEVDAPATGRLRRSGVVGQTYQVGDVIGEIV